MFVWSLNENSTPQYTTVAATSTYTEFANLSLTAPLSDFQSVVVEVSS